MDIFDYHRLWLAKFKTNVELGVESGKKYFMLVYLTKILFA